MKYSSNIISCLLLFTIILVSAVSIASSWAIPPEQAPPPTPDIKANGADGPVTISQSDTLSVTGEYDAMHFTGYTADWWVLAETPFLPQDNWYYFDLNSGWMTGISVTYQGYLFDLSPYEVLKMSGLPVGTYTFYFGIDLKMDGILDMQYMYYDSVQVWVTEQD